MSAPAATVRNIEHSAHVPSGSDERFSGYALMAQPFQSGHILALRRWPASSIGPAYTSIWHRSPQGAWTFYADAPADRSCARYFGCAAASVVETPIELSWPDERTLDIEIGGEVGLSWRLTLTATPVTRALNGMASAMPGPFWRQGWFLSVMGRMAGPMLGAGRIRLHGRVPNGQSFIANPRRIWLVSASSARLHGEDLGPIGPLAEPARLADFWLPQRGIFAVAQAYMEPFDAQRHLTPAPAV
jgi:hypothetical protein